MTMRKLFALLAVVVRNDDDLEHRVARLEERVMPRYSLAEIDQLRSLISSAHIDQTSLGATYYKAAELEDFLRTAMMAGITIAEAETRAARMHDFYARRFDIHQRIRCLSDFESANTKPASIVYQGIEYRFEDLNAETVTMAKQLNQDFPEMTASR